MARRRRERIIRLGLVLSDSLALVLGGFLALLMRYGTFDAALQIRPGHWIPYWHVVLAIALTWLTTLALQGLYDTDRLTWGMGELSRAAGALALGAFVVIIGQFALTVDNLSRAWLVLAWLDSVLLVWLGRLAIRALLDALRKAGRLLRPVLIIGANEEAERLVVALQKAPVTGMVPVGCISDEQDAGCRSADVLGTTGDMGRIIREHGVDTAVIASSAFDHEQIAEIIAELRKSDASVHMSSGLFEVLTSRVFVREVAGVPMITVKGVSFTPGRLLAKRTFDSIVSAAIILLGLPLWLFVAIAIKTTSPGPVFYRQQRIGKDGRPFGMFKFRSMVADADTRREHLGTENEADGPIFKIRNDPRITPIGRWIRKYSIDEFPQLLNVLRGEMSLVGPRPPLPCETEAYEDRHWRRLEAIPGMTGLWQVSGRSDLSFEEMIRLDIFYIENWSIGFDITLLFRTIPAVLFARGAY